MKIKFKKKDNSQPAMLKELTLILFLGLVGVVMHLGVKAAEDTVTATVTAEQVSLSVDPGTISYGTLSVGTTENTVGLGQSQAVINTSNVDIDLELKGQTSAEWGLSDTAAEDVYVHEYCYEDCSGTATWYALGTGYTAAISTVAAGTTTPFDFQIHMPSATTASETQNVDVTILCSSSGS